MKKKKSSFLCKFVILIDVIGLITFFVVYGPFSFFRDWFVTSGMTSMSHRYFVYTLYNEETINEVLENNRVEEPEEDTDTSKVNTTPVVDTGVYESIYEEQILKKDNEDDKFKIVNIEGDGYKGYMAVIYDAADLQLVFSSKYGKGGEYISTMAKNNNALLATNASGVTTSKGKNPITGTAIVDGKVYAVGNSVNKGGGLIGFTKDNVLMLTKKSAKEAIEAGMDRAVEFGPFLIVNGEEATFSGNGGWGIANRTAIGQRQDGIVLLIVIDGRTASSQGISMVDLKDLFVKYGAYNAANLDGGGSSAMYAVVDGVGGLINNPKGYNYSGERYLPNAWMILGD